MLAGEKGIKAFVAERYTDGNGIPKRGYTIGRLFDVSQTSGKALAPRPRLLENTRQMDLAFETLIRTSTLKQVIRKIYELGFENNPAYIPLDSFERDGYIFTCTDVLRQEISEKEKKDHTETVTLDSGHNDTTSVLSLLPETKEIETFHAGAGA